jgi:hypothetical protein
MQVSSRFARLVLFSTLLVVIPAAAQVLAPEEIHDPQLRELQKKYFAGLKSITDAAAVQAFPYRFYFSRTLGLSEKDQQKSDRRAVQFDQYRQQTVLKITGNYFAAYSAELLKPEERARQTYQDVILPLLRVAVPAVEQADALQAFAFEISHHVRRRVLGVSSEGTENVVVIIPKASARRLVAASDPALQQAALLEGETFLNAAPVSLWPRLEVTVAPPPAATPQPVRASTPSPISAALAASAVAAKLQPPTKPQSEVLASVRDTAPQALKTVQSSYQSTLDRMVQELNSQAHFVRYAPPAFIPFRKGLYLQVSVTTPLPESAGGSQYRLAALAFDQHIAHLIRPTLAYVKEDRGDFDGIDFSTSVRLGTGGGAEGSTIAVEFIFPLAALRAYEQFDSTGQQLIDGGFVLINGERVSLNLQVAEAGVKAE